MASLGLQQMEEYWQLLTASNDELQELIEAVVVPETWFFRDPDAFAALSRLVSEEWLPNFATKRLRLLSIPCSTGEEPYSMVMALLDMGLPRERFEVDAVDISVRALARARRGAYGSNSFRGGNLGFRDRYFEQGPTGYSLGGRLRDAVAFHRENLLAPDFRAGSAAYDVIFCRNVLIYFDRATQEQAMKILGSLLLPSGFLFVGPAEAFLAASCGFKSIRQSMCFAFRKNSVAPTTPAAVLRPRSSAAVKKSLERHDRHLVKARIPALPPPTTVISDSIHLARARELGDAGKFAEAVMLCEDLLARQGPTSETYYLLGVVRDAMGDLQRAAECYRKVLYLEPKHSEALLHLALLSDKKGDTIDAARLRERAKRAEKGA
jgi:chemotaxis protein methyltransferase WspC